MNQLILSNSKHVALVDDDLYDHLNQWTWYAHCRNGGWYVERSEYLGGGRKNRQRKTHSLHNVIMNPPEGFIVDHINRNGFDNRKINLRLATKAQNSANRTSAKNSSSIYLGVTFVKPTGRWRSRLRKNGKSINLGTFDKETEAALAYNKAAIEFHGEFANINKIS